MNRLTRGRSKPHEAAWLERTGNGTLARIRRAGLAAGMMLCVVAPASLTAQSRAASLDSARAANQRGDAARAASLYLTVLQSDSASRPALRELADVYSAQGKWRDALPFVKRLASLGESNFALERDLGQWLAWAGETDAGLVHLRKAVALEPDSISLRLALGQALTWSPRARPEGLAMLKELERIKPSDRDIRHAIASAQTWDPSTRAEGVRRLAALVREDTAALDLLTEYADVLSWVPETRAEALTIYGKVAARSPGNLGAARGRLNVYTWTGRSRDALALADSLLVRVPNDSILLLGRGNLLVQAGRPADAVAVLRPQLARAPGNTQLAEQLAYALVAAGQFSEARRVASRLTETTFPSAPDWVRRGAAPIVGTDVVVAHTSFGLTLTRVLGSVSVPIATGTRVSLTGGPTQFVAPSERFVSGSVAAAIEKRATRLSLARLEVGAEQYQNAPTGWSAAAEFEAALARRGTLRFFVRRAAVEDSRRAASGLTENGTFIGQVRANSTGLVLRLPSIGAGLSLLGTAGVGVYTGASLRDNTRRDASLSVTRAFGLGAGNAQVELGTGVAYFGFAFDANRGGPGALRSEYGGYWSPKDFGNAFLSLGLIVPLNGRLTWRTDGSVGQLVSGRSAAPNANSFNANTELRLVGRHGWDASGGFFYLDNLGGFRLQQARLSLRHAF